MTISGLKQQIMLAEMFTRSVLKFIVNYVRYKTLPSELLRNPDQEEETHLHRNIIKKKSLTGHLRMPSAKQKSFKR